MKKIILATLVAITGLSADANLGFLANQKYICISQGTIANGKLIPTPQEEAMKYPIRFYIDDNNVMHTDAKLTLPHMEKTTYSDGDNRMGLIVEKDKRYVVTTNKQLKSLGAAILYVCAETKNWTIAR